MWCVLVFLPLLTGGGSTSVPVPGAAAQHRFPGGWRGGELAERPGTRTQQAPQPADAQQAAGTQALAHHPAAHPGQTAHAPSLPAEVLLPPEEPAVVLLTSGCMHPQCL